MKRVVDFYKNLKLATRIYAGIILLVILLLTLRLISGSTFLVIVMLMAMFMIIETFRSHLYKTYKNPGLKKWLIVAFILLILGVACIWFC